MPIYTFERLDLLVRDRLGGDKTRLLELFETRDVYDQLKAAWQASDWVHFEPNTFDGLYFVETSIGFRVYQQDRGAISNVQTFQSLRDAARSVFA